MVKAKLLPSPTLLSTHIRPPSASTSFFAMARPMPVVGAVEPLEHVGEVRGRYAYACVPHDHSRLGGPPVERNSHAAFGVRVYGGIREEVSEHFAHGTRIGDDYYRFGRDGEPNLKPPRLHEGPKGFCNRPNRFADVQGPGMQLHTPML